MDPEDHPLPDDAFALDVLVEREQRRRHKKIKVQEDALDAAIKGVDLSAWYADNTGAAHAPHLGAHLPMTPIDTQPVDPYLGCCSITEIMRRPTDESHVDADGKSHPSSGSGSFNGGGVAKRMPRAKNMKAPAPQDESAVAVFRLRNLTHGERHVCDIYGQYGLRDIARQHITAVLKKEVAFVPVSNRKLPRCLTYVNIYGLNDAEAQLLRLHKGSMRKAIVTFLHDKYAQRISEIDADYEECLAS